MSVEQTFFPFGLKWKPLLWRHVMISVKSFSPKVKSMNSSFIKNMNIFDIFYHFPQFEHNKSEVWKGKNLCPWGVNFEFFFYSYIDSIISKLLNSGNFYTILKKGLCLSENPYVFFCFTLSELWILRRSWKLSCVYFFDKTRTHANWPTKPISTKLKSA